MRLERSTPPIKFLKMSGKGNTVALIRRGDIHTFVKLFDEITESVGTAARTRTLTGVALKAMTDMISLKRLTVTNARRILAAYRNLTKGVKA